MHLRLTAPTHPDNSVALSDTKSQEGSVPQKPTGLAPKPGKNHSCRGPRVIYSYFLCNTRTYFLC